MSDIARPSPPTPGAVTRSGTPAGDVPADRAERAPATSGKAAARRRVLAARTHLTVAQHSAVGRALVGAVAALRPGLPRGPVAAYVSLGTEPTTRPLLAAQPDLLLPVLLPDGDLDWARAEGGLVTGPRGLLEPAGPRLGPTAVAECVLVLVPALAVDAAGTRLGRGGGSYDRALARAGGLVLAVLHDGELVDELPAEPHDRPVHGAVLPSGLVRTRPHPTDPATHAGGEMAP